MNKFTQLILASVLGSGFTLLATWFYEKEQPKVVIEHMSSTPASAVAYTTNEAGNIVPLDFTTTANKATNAVVHIRSTQLDKMGSSNQQNYFRDFFYPPMRRQPSKSSGSGVVISPEGYIVTNYHVVRNAEIVEVTLFDNSVLKAEVIGTDPDTDIALIKINRKDLYSLSFVDSDSTKIGQWVLAVGNPFNLNSTVTAGIISAKGRNINIINSNNFDEETRELANTSIESFIQTDAAINPGNSGGALVDLQGGLLGINTAIASPTGTYAGYGFAIPSNIAEKVVEDLLSYGVVQRGWLGVSVQSVNGELAKREGLDRNEGAFVIDFADNSSAKEAGLKSGDVIIKLDKTVIKSSTDLIAYIGKKRPGDKVDVIFDRDGETKKTSVILKNRDGEITAVKREKEKESYALLGLNLEEVDAKTLRSLDLQSGVRVSRLQDGKLKRYTEMKTGFIITHIDNSPVRSVEEVEAILRKKKKGALVTFAGVYEDFPREYIYALRM